MKLHAWLKKEPTLAERLKVIASLCNALADAHRRGVVRGGLTPASVSVVNDGVARLEPGGVGPGSPYAAPELAQGGAPTAKSDIYSAAALIYEILSGKPPFESDPPRPLQEARPDLSQDLTDAVSACMEQDPEWRPADLAYLTAVVQQLQQDQPEPSRSPAPRASSARPSGPTPTFLNPAPGKRQDDRSALTRALPLILVVVAVVGTAGAWLWYNVLQPARPASPGARSLAQRPASAPPLAQPEPASAASPALAPTGDPLTLPTPVPSASAPGPEPSSRPSAPAAPSARSASPGPAATSRPSPPALPVTLPAAPPSTVVSIPERNPAAGEPASPPAPEPEPAAAATEPPAAGEPPAGPAAIRAVAPFRLKAGSLQVLDVHGSGLRSDHRARIVPLRKREPAAGFMVTRYQLRSPGLLLVFVQVDGAVPAGKYALSLVDAAGAETNPFTIEVSKK